MSVPTGTYVFDSAHSEVGFSVRHVGIAKVRGRFADFDGAITVAEDFAASNANARIVASSVDTGDATRDNHLRSNDFFDVDKRPEWNFVSTGVRGAGENFALVGDLTINGVTRPVELEVEYNGTAVDPWGQERVGFSAATEISRKEFGLTWNVALEAGGVLVGDKVKVGLEISAVKQA